MCVYYVVMQNYKNLAKFFPLFHFVATPLVTIYWISTGVQLRGHLDTPHIMAFLGAFGVVAATFASRVMALAVQDRVIRLEMRLRLKDVLPANQQADIAKISRSQFVGLRFARDAELPALVAKVLKDDIQKADTIKQMVKDWVADDLRA